MADTFTDPSDRLLALFRNYVVSIGDRMVRSFVVPIDWSMARRSLRPRRLDCLRHLDAIAVTGKASELTSCLVCNAGLFSWGQTYSTTDLAQSFVDNYGWLELFGIRGHYVNDQTAAGFLVLGPNTHYPDHHHLAEETYIPLTGGTEWRMGDGNYVVRDAGTVIHHPSNVSHAMRTGEDPLLAIYLWRGGPLAQKSTIAPAARAG